MSDRRVVPACIALVCLPLTGLAVGLALREDAPRSLALSGFAFELEIAVPGAPEDVFDLFTGDVSPWWDHHYSEKPTKLFIEPKPGGAFIELFDDEGNGALHAQVLIAERGKELVFRGPLGFGRTGVHLDFVHRVTFTADGDGTRVHLTVHGAGEVEQGWPESVQQVWQHFLVEQFQGYATKKLGG